MMQTIREGDFSPIVLNSMAIHVNLFPSLLVSVRAPYGFTSFIVNGPDQRDRSFPGNRVGREL